MPEPVLPPIGELLPHRGRAVLLGRVISHNPKTTVCTVDPDAGELLRDANGCIPAYFGLEFMAQAIAAHGGLLDRAAGREAKPGFFLGSRRLVFAVDRFEPEQALEISATHLRGATGMLAFDCAIRRPGQSEPMVSGILTVYLLESFAALSRDFAQPDAESRDS